MQIDCNFGRKVVCCLDAFCKKGFGLCWGHWTKLFCWCFGSLFEKWYQMVLYYERGLCLHYYYILLLLSMFSYCEWVCVMFYVELMIKEQLDAFCLAITPWPVVDSCTSLSTLKAHRKEGAQCKSTRRDCCRPENDRFYGWCAIQILLISANERH